MSNSSVETRVCVITGGSAGIGFATAQRFAQDGFAVAICGRNQDRLRAAHDQLASICASPEHAHASVHDLSQPGAAGQFVAKAAKHFGRIDVLINNAGVAVRAAVDTISQTDFDRLFAINVRATFEAVQAVWPPMRAQGGGTIVNLSSVAAVAPFGGFSVYGASKAWVDLFSQAVAAEGKPLNIRVFSVRPGAVDTEMLHRAVPEFPVDEALPPTAVADVIRELCEPSWKYAAGQAIRVAR